MLFFSFFFFFQAEDGIRDHCVTGVQTCALPILALEADTSPGNYVAENGSWWIVGGTSDAAPQWAGLAAALAQQRGGPLGNPGALLYGLCGTAALHDVTSGSNGDYSARSEEHTSELQSHSDLVCR